jgi:ribose-phosphate pyrophosphokinase
MKTTLILNLTNEFATLTKNIKYKLSQFPDGQQDITILDTFISPDETVLISSRFNNFKDLELIICSVKALRNLGIKTINLYIPYILGARSDRKFLVGGTSYLRDVVSPILNSLNLNSVICLDAHSDVAEACINNLINVNNYKLIKWAISDQLDKSDYLLVSPDGGALKKIFKVSDYLKNTNEIIVCSKYRDTDGKLSRTHVPIRIDHFAKDLIIIDDICDGGNTFINIAKEIKEVQPERTGKIILVVTHGIFSAGFEKLSQYFDKIYCTNSVKNIQDPLVEQLDIFN